MFLTIVLYIFLTCCDGYVAQGTYPGECGTVEMVSRERWGARPSRENDTMEMPVRHIFIHHTSQDQCSNFTTCVGVAKFTQDFHMDIRGWADVGYNFLIGGDGRVYVGRGWNRVGAHTYGFNRISIAFSFMGDFMKEAPSDNMLKAAKKMIKCAVERGYVTQDYELHGHRDAGCTSCPGDALYSIIRKWDRFVEGPLPGAKCWRPNP